MRQTCSPIARAIDPAPIRPGQQPPDLRWRQGASGQFFRQFRRRDELGCLPDWRIDLKEPFPGANGRSFYLNPGGAGGRVVPNHRPARREQSNQESLITYGSDR